MLLGSTNVKAARKTLVKLAPAVAYTVRERNKSKRVRQCARER